jgi:hypothetical protein
MKHATSTWVSEQVLDWVREEQVLELKNYREG